MRRFTSAALLASIAAQPLAAQPQGDAAFNPAISLTLMGQYANYHHLDQLDLPGFQLGGEAGLPERGFNLDHTELTLSANIDPYFFGQMTVALGSHDGETELELEEAFLETSALPAGLSLTFGRFFSGVGYLNSHHNHSWDFVDAPLPTQAFLGGGYYDDGLRLSWLAPTPLFLEIGAEAFRGDSFPAAAAAEDDLGAHTVFAHLGGDIGFDHSWQLGLSRLWSDPAGRTSGRHHDDSEQNAAAFTGSSTLTIIDAVWKWAPGGNLQARHLTLQGEYFHRSEAGHLDAADNATANYRGTQKGWYAQTVYRFLPRWRAGLRYDRLWSDNRSEAPAVLAAAGLADAAAAAQRYSAMVDFSPSEFSRLRLQFTRSDLDGGHGNAVFLQYIMSLGAHGAHRF